MDKIPGLVLTLLVLAVVFALMLRSWRRRTRRDHELPISDDALTLGRPLWSGTVGYLATTPVERPLDRLTPPGLAFRGEAELTVAPEGIRLKVRREPAITVAAHRLRGAQPVSWTIDRGVGPDGLLAIVWVTSGDDPVLVHSVLRVQDHTRRAQLSAALTEVSPASTPSPTDQHLPQTEQL